MQIVIIRKPNKVGDAYFKEYTKQTELREIWGEIWGRWFQIR